MSTLLPLFPLDVVLLPGAPLPLHVFEPRYKEMIGELLSKAAPFGMVRAKEEAVAEIGCTAEIVELVKKYEDGRMDIMTVGRRRFQIVELNQERSFLQAEVSFFEDEPGTAASTEIKKLIELHENLLVVAGAEKAELEADDPQLSFQLAGSLPLDLDLKQTLLGMRSEKQRVSALIEYYQALIPKLQRTIKVREKSRGNGHAM